MGKVDAKKRRNLLKSLRMQSGFIMHAAVVLLFLAAIVFYIIGLNAPAIGLIALGFIFELLAWSTWFGESFKSQNDEDTENKL